ncbi:MAG: DUF5655 domain-containing protein [Chitinophagaceae bacterium]
MKVKAEINGLWTCTQCGRQFERQGQSHSCKAFPLKQHFEGKPGGTLFYKIFKQAVKRQIGHFRIESLECCIHFVNTSTFASIKIMREKIKVEFSLARKISNKRLKQPVQLSANSFLYFVNISSEDEIDGTLLKWIKEAYKRRSRRKSKSLVAYYF